MILAKNNIIVKIKDCNEYAIFNPLSGSFDMMEEADFKALQTVSNDKSADQLFTDYLLERGYAYHSAADEQHTYMKAYDEFQEEIANSQVQLMLIPTYGCNLACVYCYQKGVDAEYQLITKEAADAFFDYARKNFSGRTKKPFITLFGGEPLIHSPAQRKIISYIVDKCVAEDYELAAVTNGYDFIDYIDILKNARIKEIQFTLDGSREVHNMRRATANGRGTFDRVISGIAAAIEAGFPVNLRTVVDLENIEDLVRLAEYLDAKGWLDLPPERFKTQIGRNYELFNCYAKPQHLMTQVELWAAYSKLSREFPVLEKFHRPNFYGIRHLIDTGALYMASFDTCPACKTEWVFDLNGEIYGCTASCGRHEYLLGTYYPEVRIDQDAVSCWRERSVLTIEKCKSCKYDVICGGGCGVVAANKNNGEVLSPDCRPVQEITELGINHYIDNIRAMTDVAPDEAPAASHDVTEKNSCCTGDKLSGCVVCGSALVYADTPSAETCLICGKMVDSAVTCEKGHYICDVCHGADILTKIERFLSEASEDDPIKLAKKVFDLPGLKMHGPEYHSIVPAVLVAAYQNKIGQRNPAAIKEAIRRGKDVKGGSCGYSGGCGSAIGAGIAASILEKATPLSDQARGSALRMSGQALLDISCHGGPRCCKRDAVTSIQTFMKKSGYFDSTELSRYVCKQFKTNKDCIGSRCPFYPKIKIAAKGK